VLDNCEHVLDAAADIAADLLGAGPHVRVLATSREPLRLPEEQVIALDPLAVPASADDPAAATCPAVVLFARRAAAARSDFRIDARTLPEVVRICRALDGVPLALEIAGARVQSMSVRDIADRLDRPFALLRASTRRVPDRHRSLRAVIDWSWQLLTPAERTLLAVLAVYPSADLAAATAAGLDGDEVIDLLEGLVAKSLLSVRISAGRTRYGMPETLRAYGMERLEEAGALAQARTRHADHYAALARHTRTVGLRAWTPEAFAALAVEFDNLRAALAWTLLEDESPQRSFDLLAPLWYFCQLQGEEEIVGLTDRALNRWPQPNHPLWSEVAATAAEALVGIDEMGRARLRARQAIEANTSPVGAAYAWRTLAEVSAFVDDDSAAALAHLDQAEQAAHQVDYEPLLCELTLLRAQILAQDGRTREALKAAERALTLAREQANVFMQAWSGHLLGMLLAAEQPAAAREWMAAALEQATALGNPYAASSAVRGMAVVTAQQGDVAAAARLFCDAIDRFTRIGCRIERWTTVAALLPLLVQAGRRDTAASLLRGMDAAQVVVKRIHAPSFLNLRRELATDVRAPLVLARSQALSLDQLFGVARGDLQRLAGTASVTAPAQPVQTADGTGELRRVGDLWQLTFAGSSVHLPDLKGMHDLAVLLQRPGRDVPALDLAAATTPTASPAARATAAEADLGVPGDLGEQLDAQARAAYAARIRALQADLDDADTAGDPERAARAQQELDFLTGELSAAYGLHGPRRAGDPADKARAAVTGRIRAALAKIRGAHPMLGRHLDRSIYTGRFCSYRPDEPTTWRIAR
jgi:predicted ATPase